MRRTDDASLWPWPLTLKLVRNVTGVVEYPHANFFVILRLLIVDLWAIGRGRTSVNGARRHRYRSIRQQQLILTRRELTNNCFLGDKILDLKSNFLKWSSIPMLRSLIRIPLGSLVQIDTEIAEKFASQRYAVSSHWKICRTMCVSINGPDDLDLWPFDLETGTRVASQVGNLHFEFGHTRPFGSGVIHYVRDGRKDRRTDKSNAYCPFPTCRGVIIAFV